jgi:hypothetical protein
MFGSGIAFVGNGRFLGIRVSEGPEVGLVSSAIAPGGSGSGVFYKGKLIGMVIAVNARFDHSTIFIPITTIKRFLDR